MNRPFLFCVFQRAIRESPLLFPPERRGFMVTYEELFLLGSLIVSIITLVIEITKKK